MQTRSAQTLGAALALGVVFALTACGSSSTGEGGKSTATAAAATASAAATVAAPSATAVRPLATLAANLSPSVTPPPPATRAASTPSPVPTAAPTVAPTAKPGRSAATTDVLEPLALKLTDLPSGFISTPLPASGAALAEGQTGAYTAVFSSAPRGASGGQGLLLGLTAFVDARTAGNSFKSSLDGAGARAKSLGSTVEPVAGDASLGDERAFLHQVSNGGASVADGYIIIFRRGTVGVLLSLTGANGAGPQSIDSLLALAKLQDERLRAAGF